MDQESKRFDERLNALFASKELETLRGHLARIAASDAICGQPLLPPDPPGAEDPEARLIAPTPGLICIWGALCSGRGILLTM